MLQLKFFCLFIAFISHNCSMFKYIHIQFGLTMYFTINKDSFFYLRHMVFTLYRRQSVQSEFPFISLQTWHKFGSTSRNFDRGRKGEGGGLFQGMSYRPTHNQPRPQLHMWLPTPFSPPPHPHPLIVSPTVVSPVQYQVPASLTYLQQVSQTYFTYLSQSGSLKQKIGWHIPGLLKCAWWNSSYVKLRKQNVSWLNSCLSSKPEENVSH